MTVKTLLGLETCPLSDCEIMERIEGAKRRSLHQVEFFSAKRRRIVVKIPQIDPSRVTYT